MSKLSFRNGDQMPAFGLGTWKSSKGDVYKAVLEAIRVGYRHIDCALIYGNEAEVGDALAEAFKIGLVQREELWITSKLWNNSHHPDSVKPGLQTTLSDLGLEYLDLYLIHWPVHLVKEVMSPSSAEHYIAFGDLPITETWREMEKLVADGVVKHIGVSNFSIRKLENLIANSSIAPEMNQIELHPYLQQPEMVDFCTKNNIHLTAYAPLGSGDRPAGLKSDDEPILFNDEVLIGIAEKHGVSVAQVLISWALQRGTSVIPKSVSPIRLQENFDAQSVKLADDEMTKISSLDRHMRYVTGLFWTGNGSPYTVENLWDE